MIFCLQRKQSVRHVRQQKNMSDVRKVLRL